MIPSIDGCRNRRIARCCAPSTCHSMNGSAGLVSTADDFNAFARVMLNGGRLRNERILSRPSVELMTTDQLTSEQKPGSEIFFGDNRGWGMGLSVVTRRDDLYNVPGRFGWDGGYGLVVFRPHREPHRYSADPAHDGFAASAASIRPSTIEGVGRRVRPQPNGLVRGARGWPTITSEIISQDLSVPQNPIRLVGERRYAAGAEY
jgi:CubicO group peptidase (beta-lactamase class C family)